MSRKVLQLQQKKTPQACPLTSTGSHSVGSCRVSEVEFKPGSLPHSVLLPRSTGITQINTPTLTHSAAHYNNTHTNMHLKAHIFTCVAHRPLSLWDTCTHTPAYMGGSACLYGDQVGLVPPTQVPDRSCVYRKQTPLMNSETVAKCQTSAYTNAISDFFPTLCTVFQSM